MYLQMHKNLYVYIVTDTTFVKYCLFYIIYILYLYVYEYIDMKF